MIVLQLFIVCTDQMINVPLSLEEQLWVTLLPWGTIILSLMTVKLVFKTSSIVAVKFLVMILQLRYVYKTATLA